MWSKMSTPQDQLWSISQRYDSLLKLQRDFADAQRAYFDAEGDRFKAEAEALTTDEGATVERWLRAQKLEREAGRHRAMNGPWVRPEQRSLWSLVSSCFISKAFIRYIHEMNIGESIFIRLRLTGRTFLVWHVWCTWEELGIELVQTDEGSTHPF